MTNLILIYTGIVSVATGYHICQGRRLSLRSVLWKCQAGEVIPLTMENHFQLLYTLDILSLKVFSLSLSSVTKNCSNNIRALIQASVNSTTL